MDQSSAISQFMPAADTLSKQPEGAQLLGAHLQLAVVKVQRLLLLLALVVLRHIFPVSLLPSHGRKGCPPPDGPLKLLFEARKHPQGWRLNEERRMAIHDGNESLRSGGWSSEWMRRRG